MGWSQAGWKSCPGSESRTTCAHGCCRHRLGSKGVGTGQASYGIPITHTLEPQEDPHEGVLMRAPMNSSPLENAPEHGMVKNPLGSASRIIPERSHLTPSLSPPWSCPSSLPPPWTPCSCPAPMVCPHTQPEGPCEHMALLCSQHSFQRLLPNKGQGQSPAWLCRPHHSRHRGSLLPTQIHPSPSQLRAFAMPVPSAGTAVPIKLLCPLLCFSSKLLPQ